LERQALRLNIITITITIRIPTAMASIIPMATVLIIPTVVGISAVLGVNTMGMVGSATASAVDTVTVSMAAVASMVVADFMGAVEGRTSVTRNEPH